MAFCHNCGNELAPGNKFCAKCGASVADAPVFIPTPEVVSDVAPEITSTEEVQAEPVQGVYAPIQEQAPEAPKPPKKPIDKKKLGITIGIIAMVVILVVAAVLVITGINKKKRLKAANERKKVVVREFIETEFEGYDSLGTLDVDISSDIKFEILYSSGVNLKKDKDGEYIEPDFDKLTKKEIEKYTLARSLYTSFYVSADYRYELSNGDKVKITLSYDEDIAKKLGVNIIFEEYEVEVTDLKELKEVNPFDSKYFSIVQSGKDGYINVEVKKLTDDKWLDYLSYSYDGWYHSVGDIIEFTISDYNYEVMVSTYGIKLTERSYKYTIEDADKYIQDVNDISEDLDTYVDSIAKEQIESECSTEVSYEITGYECIGKYLFAEEDENAAFYIYKVTMKLKNGDVIDGYVALKLSNIVQCLDGSQTYNEYVSFYNNYYYLDDIKIKTYKSEVALFDYIYGNNMSEGTKFTMTDGLTSYVMEVTDEELEEIGALVTEVYNAINDGDVDKLKELTLSPGIISVYFEDEKEVAEMIEEDLDDNVTEYSDAELGEDIYVYTVSQMNIVKSKIEDDDITAPEFEKIVRVEVNFKYHDNYWKEDGSDSMDLKAYKEDGKWYILYFLDYFALSKLDY